MTALAQRVMKKTTHAWKAFPPQAHHLEVEEARLLADVVHLRVAEDRRVLQRLVDHADEQNGEEGVRRRVRHDHDVVEERRPDWPLYRCRRAW